MSSASPGTTCTATRPSTVVVAVTCAAELAARVLLRLLDALPSSRARVGRAVGGLALAAGAAMSSMAACGPLDFACKADAWGEGVVEGLRQTFSSLTHSMIQGIFSGSLGTLGAGGWTAGIALAGRVGAIMAIVVVALAAVQIIMTLISRQREGILRAAIGAALAWPVASTAVWTAMQLVRVIDAISSNMVDDSHIETLGRLTDFTMVVGMATPLTAGLVTLFFVFCVFIPTVLVSLMMAFRNYGIVLAVAVAPVSLMVWGFSSLRQMSRGWLKVVLALILTKPILAIALVLAAEMIVQSAGTLDIGGFLTGIAGLAMAVFAPFAAMGMVSGAMAIADNNIMRGAEGSAGRMISGGARKMGNKLARSEAAQNLKKAGTQAVGAAAQSNPKTAALWNLANGLRGKGQGSKPGGQAGGNDPGAGNTAGPDSGLTPKPGGGPAAGTDPAAGNAAEGPGGGLAPKPGSNTTAGPQPGAGNAPGNQPSGRGGQERREGNSGPSKQSTQGSGPDPGKPAVPQTRPESSTPPSGGPKLA